jgi:hypothetical protein
MVTRIDGHNNDRQRDLYSAIPIKMFANRKNSVEQTKIASRRICLRPENFGYMTYTKKGGGSMVDVLARELVSRMQIMPKKKERKRISYEKKQASLGKINQAKFNEESDGSRKKTTNNTDLISYKAVIICYLH